MKVSVALCVLALVTLAYCRPEGTGCRYGPWGKCISYCEEGTHSYSSGCHSLMTREPTCDNPTPQEEMGPCDYSACYCDAPTVRDTASGKCVPLEQCPKK